LLTASIVSVRSRPSLNSYTPALRGLQLLAIPQADLPAVNRSGRSGNVDGRRLDSVGSNLRYSGVEVLGAEAVVRLRGVAPFRNHDQVETLADCELLLQPPIWGREGCEVRIPDLS